MYWKNRQQPLISLLETESFPCVVEFVEDIFYFILGCAQVYSASSGRSKFLQF